jgi:hypothetical protein
VRYKAWKNKIILRRAWYILYGQNMGASFFQAPVYSAGSRYRVAAPSERGYFLNGGSQFEEYCCLFSRCDRSKYDTGISTHPWRSSV